MVSFLPWNISIQTLSFTVQPEIHFASHPTDTLTDGRGDHRKVVPTTMAFDEQHNDTYAVLEGSLFNEMNSILRWIRKRESGEPTPRERERLKDIREELTALRKGLTYEGGRFAKGGDDNGRRMD